jgi:CheY-like chemotaxis protein
MTVQAGSFERALLSDSRPDAATAREQRTLLVIDDDALVLETLCEILREGGYRVLAARDGKFALALIAATAVDLVVTDVFMPDMDGLEVLRALRRQRPHLPVVVMSGNDQPRRFDARSAASLMGAVEWIAKPVTAGALLDSVARILAATPPA